MGNGSIPAVLQAIFVIQSRCWLQFRPCSLFWLLCQKLRHRMVHFRIRPSCLDDVQPLHKRHSSLPHTASNFSTNGIQPRPETASNLPKDEHVNSYTNNWAMRRWERHKSFKR